MSKSRLFALSACVLAAGLVACKEKPAAETAANTTAPMAGSAVTSPYSVNQMMVMIVDRPGERLWEVEKDGKAPKTDEQWYQLENHAVELGSAATLIRLGGTGPNDANWAKEAVWQSSGQALTDAAKKAELAAHNKDLKALVAANGEIVDACEACHKQFKPNIPTGGLFMHQPATGS